MYVFNLLLQSYMRLPKQCSMKAQCLTRAKNILIYNIFINCSTFGKQTGLIRKCIESLGHFSFIQTYTPYTLQFTYKLFHITKSRQRRFQTTWHNVYINRIFLFSKSTLNCQSKVSKILYLPTRVLTETRPLYDVFKH